MCYFECTPETETVCTLSSINKFETRFLNACLKWKTISSIAQKHSGTLTTYLGDLFKKEWSVLDSQLHFFQLLSVFFCSVLHILPEMEKLSVYYRLPLTVADQEWWILRSVPIFKCFFKVAVLATFVILLILNAGEKKPYCWQVMDHISKALLDCKQETVFTFLEKLVSYVFFTKLHITVDWLVQISFYKC